MAPSVPAVSLDEVRDHLRIDMSNEDALLLRLAWAATDAIDGPNGIGVALVEQQWEMTLDSFPSMIKIPLSPIQSVDAIEYIDGAGTTQTLDTAKYLVDTASIPARITPAYNAVWPGIRAQMNSVTIRFTAGYAADGADYTANIPEDLRTALLLLVAHFYENRSAVNVGSSVSEFPLAVRFILNKYRSGRVA